MLLIICLYFPHNSNSVVLDVYVSKDITDFDNCPSVTGPTLNITHTKDYDSLTVCWRFLVTAYPHCPGKSANLMVMRGNNPDWWNELGGDLLDYRVYQPISGMSVNGKHAGWLGWRFNETAGGSWEQVSWRSILYNQPLKIYEWQSVCVSYNKQNKRKIMFHNGFKYLDTYVKEDNIVISKNFLSKVFLTMAFRGSFTDLQVYSKPMDEENLRKWTVCRFDEPGDVFEWDITKLNLTHDDSIISDFEKVDSKVFCREKRSCNKETHIFGDIDVDPISNVEGVILCKRLNGRIKMLPTTKKEINRLADYIESYGGGWVGGVSKVGKDSESPHWFPDKGLYSFVDPETGEELINKENMEFIAKAIHSYQILEDICLHCGPGKTAIKCNWQKCKRKLVGRVLCEFESIPAIKIKGLCKQSPIDRDFILIDPKQYEGKYVKSN